MNCVHSANDNEYKLTKCYE